MYTIYFLARFYPFWGLPIAFVFFEVGMFFYHRRQRRWYLYSFGSSFFLVILAILWIIFEGFWRAGPFLKGILENLGR
jgi:hypothetical protein